MPVIVCGIILMQLLRLCGSDNSLMWQVNIRITI